MIGQTILRYEILDKLGQGGMGVVYKARDVKLDRIVALKFLPPHLSTDEEAKQRFIHEAKAASALDHVNLCTIHDIGETDSGQLFIAMAYYEGETLKQKIARGALALPQAIDYARQLAEGLGRAHEAGIIHRDVKPTNVIVTSRQRVKLLDFGLAKMADVTLTKTGSTLGTVAYMSPEQARGEAVDQRTDVWSLGVVLYEMLAGCRPFAGDYAQAVLYGVLNVDPEPVTAVRAEVSPALGRIVRRALEKNAAHRYPNMQLLIGELKTVSSGEPTAPEQKKSIVVLPFTNLSPDPDQEYFSDGLTEEVIADLSQVRALRVISRTSSMMLKGTQKDVRTIGRELDVQYVLEGSVRKAGQQIRITAQLIDALNDAQCWGEKYRGTLDDVFDIQEQVSRAIVAALRVRLSSHEEAAIAEHPIPNLLAYDFYLRARHDIYASNAESLKRALANLERGLALTGKNSVMLRGMGLVKFQLVNMGIDTSKKWIEELFEIASDLEEIDPASASGPLFKGLYYELRGDARRCMSHLRIAHARDPHDQDAMFWLAIGSCSTGQVALARCLADRLVSIDPLIPLTHFFVGYTAFFDGKAGGDLDAVRHAFDIGGEAVPALLWGSVRIMAAAGCLEEARQLAMTLDERHPDAPFSSMTRGFIQALDGARREARSALTTEIEAWAGSVGEWAQFIGDYYAVLGDTDQALVWLERALSLGFLNAPFLAHGNPFLQSLRGDPRFQDLVARTEREQRAYESTLLPIACP